MQVFENRSSYTPGVDAVAKIVLSIECHPGQELAIIQWLGGVSKQAGVYSVDLSSRAVELPVAPSEPAMDVVSEPVAPAAIVEDVVEAAPEVQVESETPVVPAEIIPAAPVVVEPAVEEAPHA